MVIELSTAFTLRCSDCGHLEIDKLNIFELSSEKDLYCECGNKKCTLKQKGKKYIEISYYCLICDHEHDVLIPKDKFWSINTCKSLVCPNTDLNLGYYGSYEIIMKKLEKQQKELDSMANELGFDDFANPEVMLEVLDYLHDIAARGDLFCECGSESILIDLFSDKVKLSCDYCNSSIEIPASGKKDLKVLKKTRAIRLNSATDTKNSKDPWIHY